MGWKRKRQKWVLQGHDRRFAAELADALGIRPVVAQILINRGINTIEAGREFFACDLSVLPDPFLMLGMDKAVARVQKAFAREESIVVYGDYDADGQTAAALLVTALRELSPSPALISYYLPDRLEEGYGLNHAALAKLSKDASLVITVDCGISSVAEIEYAQSQGLDVIVTDHHEPGTRLPQAAAILNPKQDGCDYPFKELAGVGVACKLSQGLGAPNWSELLDLVALGTVADLVPLKGENRTLVSQGLKLLSQTKRPGLRALLEVAGVSEPTASHLGFRLGPRLNAAGRLGDPTRGVRLLLTEEETEARELAVELDHENSVRQDLEAKVLADAVEVVERYKLHERSALVVWGENWHQGVVGIVASRLVERYYLPTVVVSVSDDQGVASARSIAGLDMYETLRDCASLLSKFGGHPMAAGLSLPAENLLGFQKLFETLCAERISPEDYVPKLYLDGTIELNQVSLKLIEELEALEPHGFGNPAPLIQAEVSVLHTRRVGAQDNHLQLKVQDETDELAAIAFNFGEEQEQIEKHAERIALAFVPGVNEWRNEKTLQLNVKEWEPRTKGLSYVRRWMVDLYPWQLPPAYFQSGALHLDPANISTPPMFNWVDLRGTWDKARAVEERALSRERKSVLILVNTPAAALGVCRELRIKLAQGDQFIGFYHEYLTDQEKQEWQEISPAWVVSTGFGLEGTTWPSVWFWEPPLTKAAEGLWLSLVQEHGEAAALFGPKDVHGLQADLVQNYPDRQALARIYAALRRAGGEIALEDACERLENMGMLGALPIAMGVFSELGLWKCHESRIFYQPAPGQKLDLQQTVLYNKVIKMRQESAMYLRRCLERGFFQDGLKREN